MQRRIALAVSLAMTTIVLTALVALGSSVGWFSDATPAKAAKAPAVAAAPPLDDHAAALLYLAAVAGAQTEPNVVTETTYQYVDDAPARSTAAPTASRPVAQPSTAPVSTASARTQRSAQPAPQPAAQPVVQPAAPPAAAPPAAAPPAAAPAPVERDRTGGDERDRAGGDD